MFIKSIRSKIAFLYMVILGLTLTSFSVVVYQYMWFSLHENMDRLLISKAAGIENAINTYWDAEKLGLVSGGQDEKAYMKRRNINFAKIAERWVEEEPKDPRLLDTIVRIFNTDGVPIASSKVMPDAVFVPRKEFLSVLQGRQRFDTVAVEISAKKTAAVKVFSAPVFENDKVAYIVQVASPLDAVEIVLNNLKIALFMVVPIVVLATGVVGYLLAMAALHPVNSMIRTIRQITAANMKLKITVPATNDEIQRLAETFDDMLARLDNAFTSQRQFVEDMSHELKTPLTIMKGEFEVALKKARSAEEYESILKSSLEEVNKISSVVENLLIIARLESSQITPEITGVDLAVLVRNIINDMNVLADQKQIALTFSAPRSLQVRGDTNQLKRLFVNLLDNAIKYTPGGGKISVYMDSDEKQASIRVVDNGNGIPPEELEHIFDRFYRVDKSRSSVGFGLGLSIVKSIAEMHKGSISVSSQFGQGATFTVKLPL